MKKYEAPTIEFYIFETPESIMGGECNVLSCTADGVCVMDGTCMGDLSGF